MTLKILVVDDNTDAADSTAELLRLSGFDARACHDGERALVEYRAFCPDVCVLDLTMPGMDGIALAGRLRAEPGRPARLVALTALWDIATTHKTRNVGFDAHLVKPVDPARLREVLVGGPPADRA